MSFIRDFFRRRRVARHIAQYGWVFPFHGITVEIPKDSDLAVPNALMKGKYEAEEARLIAAHMPANRPVLELGGSLGVVSGLIGKHLNADVPHLIVEANPHLIDTCTHNAGRVASAVVCKAVSYDGPVAHLEINTNPHASMLSSGPRPTGSKTVAVEATTLSALWHDMGAPEGFTLISDIEGAEVDMVDKDAEILAHAGLVVMELHPHLHSEGAAVVTRISEALMRAGFSFVEQASDVYVWHKAATGKE